MATLVTGCAGFIGMHLTKRLLQRGDRVIGVDNLNDYYPVSLKEARLAQISSNQHFRFVKLDIADAEGVAELFSTEKITRVVNLAAQPGVRYSLENPQAYVRSNIVGFMNILEACRHHKVAHLVYASSSSVYGANEKTPFSVSDSVDHPISIYAATKKSNELMAYSYSHLFGLPTTGLRFFTVYGPWGRPDMAPWLFTEAIIADKPIKVFNNGDLQRDFTYIDDIVEGVVRVLDKPPSSAREGSHQLVSGPKKAPFCIYNIGNNRPVSINVFIEAIEAAVGKPAKKIMLPMQPGDMYATFADIDDLMRDHGFAPRTALSDGISQFVAWYRAYHEIGFAQSVIG